MTVEREVPTARVLGESYRRGEWEPSSSRSAARVRHGGERAALVTETVEPEPEHVPVVSEDVLPVAVLPPVEPEPSVPVVAASVGEAVEQADARDADAEPVTVEPAIGDDGEPLAEPPVEPVRADVMDNVRAFLGDREAWALGADEGAMCVEFERVAAGRELDMEAALSLWHAERVRRYEAKLAEEMERE